LSAVSRIFMSNRKKLWLFDSFEGLPEPGEGDGPDPDGIDGIFIKGTCKGSLGNIQEVFDKVGAPLSRTNIIIGKYQDTFYTMPKFPIAFLMLDSDFYEAESLCWSNFWPSIMQGGYIYMDDYFYWPGCHRAANEYWASQNFKPKIHRVGRAAWIQKSY
jgi:O-methyltransferase